MQFTLFFLLSTGIFGSLFCIWNQKTWPNAFLKLVFFAMFIFGVLVTLKHLGYIIFVG